MEKKPVVTCYGDQSLFYNLAGRVAQNLPKEPIDWKRSYGRPPKTVHVEAQFVFLEERLLQSAVHFALTEQPFFHIFWVEVCELDRYKSSVKDDISNWISILKKYNADQEWMVVIVSGMGSQEAKTPNRKINPLRTSIDDKIRADFCPKHPERVTSLLDPSKHDRGAAESWQTFMDRLRSQLMNAFNQHVSLFEDHMRTEREKRTQASWNFMDFFLLQEELAFAYEMMGLYEDALIQYDELDATFSQFVLNAGAGATTGLEWLASFTSRDVTAWDGICLSFPINQEKREMLKKRTASLLDFRNYVFSRQCSLLLLLCRPWEVARRSLPFMHQTLNELKILEVSLTDGAEACWVFLSCLEVLHTCEKYSDSSEMENYSLHTANLWAYAREKLLHLGGLCGLMPDVETSSDQLQHVIELVAGMGDRHFDVPGSPMAKLREALSSKNAFQKLYMEVAELAMGTYKHIGRIRSARLIGRDLARFYMKMGEYHKAESFFLDLLRMYQTSHWDRLTIAICKEMALCYQATGETHKYFKILTELAASSFCDPEMRKFYQKELLDCAKMIQTHLMDGR